MDGIIHEHIKSPGLAAKKPRQTGSEANLRLPRLRLRNIGG